MAKLEFSQKFSQDQFDELVIAHSVSNRSSLWPSVLGFVFTIGSLVLFAMIADWRKHNSGDSVWLKHDLSDHIGAEYDTIAQSIRKGRGFSDPFQVETGPTAWMPPVLVYFTSSLYRLADDNRNTVVEIIVFISYAVLVLAGTLVVGQGERLASVGLALAIPILGVFLCSDFYCLFQQTHDTWLIMLLLVLTWIGGHHWLTAGAVSSGERRQWKGLVLWGVFGGLVALSSPIVGFTWAMVTTIVFFKRHSHCHPTRRAASIRTMSVIAIPALVSILVTLPWTIRNRVVLGKWIPVKSNVVYELWQSQVLDDDGVLDTASAWQHPWGSDGPQRREYVASGELKFVSDRWPPTRNSIRANPLGFAKRVFNRWLAACIWFQPLERNDEQHVDSLVLRRIVHPLPFLSLLLIVFWRQKPLEPSVLITGLIYTFYLLPYVLVSYYDRYAAPVFFCKAMLVLFAIDTIGQRIKVRRQKIRLAQTNTSLHPRTAFTLIELLVVIAIIGLLVSIAVPAVQRAREAMRRTECVNRIRQVGLGVTLFHDTFQHLPTNGGPTPESTLQIVGGPNIQPFTEDLIDATLNRWGVGTPSNAGKQQTGSWAYSILPFVEQTAAFESGDCDAPQPLFACPSRPRGSPLAPLNNALAIYQSGDIAMTKTDFAANNRIVTNRPKYFAFRDILDGLNHTILAGEKSFDPTIQTETSWYWDEPIWLGGSKGTARSGLKILPDRVGIEFKDNWGSAHDGGALFVFADGHVQFVTSSVDWQLMAASLSPRDKEVETLAE
jgi:prepilin-type N-terminal cleavage/methylation domain-containing protein/prepilin-type processing-associated H-X9-DG protein